MVARYCSALGILILKAMALAYIGTIPSIIFAGLSSKPFFMEVRGHGRVVRAQKGLAKCLGPFMLAHTLQVSKAKLTGAAGKFSADYVCGFRKNV